MEDYRTIFEPVSTSVYYPHTKRDINALDHVLASCGLKVTGYTTGISIMQYRAEIPATANINKIMRLAPNISIALKDDGVKVYRKKDKLMIEKPIDGRRISVRELMNDKFFEADGLTIMLGKDAEGNNLYNDLSKDPHMLVAGMTGSGKSVFIHNIIFSITAKSDAIIIMIDPKISEYQPYAKKLAQFHLVSDNKEALSVLEDVCKEMDARYADFAAHGYRDYKDAKAHGYNIKPLIVIIDEYADLMSATKNKCDPLCVRIAQKARAAGIHLIIATQYPLVKYVSGGIKANIPVRVAFKVQNGVESRVILDRMGAEKLSGKGDMLFLGNGATDVIRIKTPYATEIETKCYAHIHYLNDRERGITERKDWRSPAIINTKKPETRHKTKLHFFADKDGYFDFTKTHRYKYQHKK